MKIPLEAIVIKSRIREELGDIKILADSIRKHGLINPITVNEKYELLAGFRRLEALKFLGYKEIECNVVNAKSKLEKFEIETEENIVRKEFTEFEIEKMEKLREILTAKWWKKILLWILRFLKWLKSLFVNDDKNEKATKP